MWYFKVLADITSMFSLYCHSMKNGNNNITMILALDDLYKCKNIDFQFWVRQG